MTYKKKGEKAIITSNVKYVLVLRSNNSRTFIAFTYNYAVGDKTLLK